jgi:hypothetical protein
MSSPETLSRELVETHLMSYIDTFSARQPDGVIRWAWALSDVARDESSGRTNPLDDEYEFKFRSYEAARDFAFGWIRRNRPALERAAVRDAGEGTRYRAARK